MVVLIAIPVVIGFFIYYLFHVTLPPGHKYSFGIKLVCRASAILERLGLLASYFGKSRWGPLRINTPNLPIPRGVNIAKTVIGEVPCSYFYPNGFQSRKTPQAAVIYFHGGGWSIGSADMYRDLIYHYVRKLDTLVLVPEYRLAPEHPFPIPYQDCFDFTQAFIKDCSSFNVDREKIVLSGDSAGGNLSTAIALEINVRMVALLYPSLQFGNFCLPSFRENKYYSVLTLNFMTRFLLSYLGLDHVQELLSPLQQNEHTKEFSDREMEIAHQRVVPSDVPNYSPPPRALLTSRERIAMDKYRDHIQKRITDSRMAPLTSTDEQLMKLPTTFVLTCQYDVLRDDGLLLVKRLERLKREVDSLNLENGFHAIVHAATIVKDKEILKSIQPMFNKINQVLQQS